MYSAYAAKLTHKRTVSTSPELADAEERLAVILEALDVAIRQGCLINESIIQERQVPVYSMMLACAINIA